MLTFKYEENHQLNEVTTVEIDGVAWFVAKDVCDLLEIPNVTVAINALDIEEKMTYELHRAGYKRNVNLVNESGLYSLIFKSRKESAKKFKKWVTSEVLPSIRKQGHYQAKSAGTPVFAAF